MNNMFLEGYGLEANPISTKNTDLFASYIFTESNEDPAGLEVILSEADASMSNLEKSGTLMSVVATLNENTQMLNEGMAEVWNKIKEIFKKFLESVKAFFSRIWTKISMSIAKQEDFVKKNMSKIMQGANYADKDGEEDKIEFIKALSNPVTAISSFTDKVDKNSKNFEVIDISYGKNRSLKLSKFIDDVIKNGFDGITKTDNNLKLKEFLVYDSTGKEYSIVNAIGFGKVDISHVAANDISANTQDQSFDKVSAKKSQIFTSKISPEIKKNSTYKISVPAQIIDAKTLGDALKDVRQEVTEEFDRIFEDTEEKKISEVIKFATDWFDKTSAKTRADNEKNMKKNIDNMGKDLAKNNKDPNPADGKFLTEAYKVYGLIQFVQSKTTVAMSKMSNHYWSIIKKAMGNFAYVNKQRNLGENANVSTSNKSTSVLSQFGF